MYARNLRARLPGLKGTLKVLPKLDKSAQKFDGMDENYIDLVEANGLRDRRYTHDDGNCKALQFTWSSIRLKPRTLVP